MADKIKITTEDLWANAKTLSNLAVRVGNVSVKNRSAITRMEKACSSLYMTGMYTQTTLMISQFTDIMNSITRGSSKAMNAAIAYEEADEKAKKSFEKWFPEVEQNTINGSTDEYKKEMKRRAIEQRINDIINKFNSGQKVPTPKDKYPDRIDGFPNSEKTQNYWSSGSFEFAYSGGCTWYAFLRFREINGYPPVFTRIPGDAKYWHNAVDNDRFKSLPIKNAEIRMNTLATRTGGKHGHVVYIEAVKDGYVYYSESNSSNPSTAGQIKRERISDFKKSFEYIIYEDPDYHAKKIAADIAKGTKEILNNVKNGMNSAGVAINNTINDSLR